jgi:hypothetical protein
MRTNQAAGAVREAQAAELLKAENPGARILSQRYLRDAQGKKLVDPVTGEGRRLDFVVVNNDVVTGITEVTSKTAEKTTQLAKTERIRALGDVFIRDPDTRKLIRVGPELQERVVRLR